MGIHTYRLLQFIFATCAGTVALTFGVVEEKDALLPGSFSGEKGGGEEALQRFANILLSLQGESVLHQRSLLHAHSRNLDPRTMSATGTAFSGDSILNTQPRSVFDRQELIDQSNFREIASELTDEVFSKTLEDLRSSSRRSR
jgi:hypothetical protein